MGSQVVAVGNTISRGEAARVRCVGLYPWALQGIAQSQTMVVPFESHPIATRRAITDVVSVMAAHALAAALSELRILETCGRIVLVEVEKYRGEDPTIPLALIHLGHKYNTAFTLYTRHLVAFLPYQGWWDRASKLCNEVIEALGEVAIRLSVEELSYLVIKLQVPLAWPEGQSQQLWQTR